MFSLEPVDEQYRPLRFKDFVNTNKLDDKYQVPSDTKDIKRIEEIIGLPSHKEPI